MKTRANITASRRTPRAGKPGSAPEGRPMARPSGPCHMWKAGRTPAWQAVLPMGAGGLASRTGPSFALFGGMELGQPALGYRCRPRPQAIVARLEPPQTGCGGAHLFRSLHAILKGMNFVDEREPVRLIGLEPSEPDSVHVASRDDTAGAVDDALHPVGIRPPGSTLDTGQRTAGVNSIDTERPRRFGEAQTLGCAPVRKLHASCKP